MSIDRYDRMILEALQRDGRISNVHLASQVNLSESATLRRVRALEEEGMIDRYAALLNQNAAGLPGNVFVQIGLHREVESELSAFEEAGLDDPDAVCGTGRRFRETVLALGGSRPPMEVFRAFRGRAPTTEALLRHAGLQGASA